VQVKKRFSIPTAIHAIGTISGDKVGILSIENSFRVFDLESFELLGGFKTNTTQSDYLVANSAIAPNGLFVSIYDADKKNQSVYYTKNKKQVFTLGEHKGLVEKVCFSPNGGYLVTAGQDGRVYLWSMKNGKLVSSLTPHSDYAVSLGFSPNGQWLASGGYDKSINVTHISSMNRKFRLKAHQSAVTQLLFLDNQRLVSTDKEGEIIVWDYANQKILKRLTKMLDEVTAIAVSSDYKFLFVVDKTRRLSLYNLQTYELLAGEYLKLKSDCKALEFSAHNNTLSIGLASGEVLFYDILEDENRLNAFIKNKSFDKAYLLVEQNPVLRYTDAYALLEQKWEDYVEVAINLLHSMKQTQAKEVLKPFQVAPEKRLFTQKILKDFVGFEKFKTAVKTKKYPLAYSIAAQYPTLEQTKYYETMEMYWHETLEKVKKLIITKDGEVKANELLKHFKGISSKAKIITSIFEEKQIVTLFQKKVAEHNYKDAILLAKKNPFLQTFEEYKKLIEKADVLEEKTKNLLLEGKYAQALKASEKLLEYDHKEEVANNLKKEANAYAQAMSLYAEKNYAALYKMVEDFPFLEKAEVMLMLENAWAKRVMQGELSATKGDVETLKQLFTKFYKIESKVPKMAELFKIAYINQIKKEIKNEAKTNADFVAVIEKYIYLFGRDDMVDDLVAKIKKYRKGFQVDLDFVLQVGDSYTWVKKDLPQNIFSKYT
jgi:hypothetical protein